jgi:hypothetical protein
MSLANVAVDGDLDDLLELPPEESTDETITDLDDLIYEQENEALPSAMPPGTEVGFEKAIRGSHLPRIRRICANNGG